MNKLDYIRRTVIESIYGKPYEEVELENCICSSYDGKGKSVCGIQCPVHRPCTIGRIMAALNRKELEFIQYEIHNNAINKIHIRKRLDEKNSDFICEWKLLNKDGSECTLEGQSKETLQKLAELLGYK